MRMIAAALAATLLGPPSLARDPWPKGVELPPGEPIDEGYRARFGECDSAGTWRGEPGRYTRGCPGDANAVTALRRLPGGAIGFVAKLAVDLDGSAFACGPDHGRMDQCPTALMLPGPDGAEVPVDADRVPYVVIPSRERPEEESEFRHLTGVRVGDFGVVLWRGRTVPVIVADTGPYPKLGEGSLALHRALGHEQCTERRGGVCSAVPHEGESIGGEVTTILFPGTARDDLTPATIEAVTRDEGSRLWRAWQAAHGAVRASASR